MAVTIDEMHVEVNNTATHAGVPAQGAEPRERERDLRESLHMLHERKLRLKAD